MIAEIIGVGTELLLGQITNTNATSISEQLAATGIDVLYHVTVGDNEERIAECINTALSRSDVVIITGGLGPTHDDLTREAIARATGRILERSAHLEVWLRERFARMNRDMPEANLKQCDLPRGATAIDNPRGTAPGIELNLEGKLILAVPGVPSEMEWMMSSHIIPMLQARSGSVLASRVLKAAGVGESALAAKIESTIKRLDTVKGATIALLASPGEVRIRITSKASDYESAMQEIKPVEDELRYALGDAVFGADDDTLESVVAGRLIDMGLTLAIAESFTGGLVTSRLIEVPGISKSLKAGYILYSREAKELDLGITIGPEGSVSEQTARKMAEGARERAGADIGLSTTGEAGPDTQEAPVGTVFIGLATEGRTDVRQFVAPGSRSHIRQWGAQGALNLLRLHLEGR